MVHSLTHNQNLHWSFAKALPKYQYHHHHQQRFNLHRHHYHCLIAYANKGKSATPRDSIYCWVRCNLILFPGCPWVDLNSSWLLQIFVILYFLCLSLLFPSLLFLCVCVAYMRLVLTPLMRCVAYFRGCFLLVYFVCVCCCFFFLFLGMGTASQSQHPGLIGIADRHIWPSNILAIETRAPHLLAPLVVEWVWPQQHAAVWNSKSLKDPPTDCGRIVCKSCE